MWSKTFFIDPMHKLEFVFIYLFADGSAIDKREISRSNYIYHTPNYNAFLYFIGFTNWSSAL